MKQLLKAATVVGIVLFSANMYGMEQSSSKKSTKNAAFAAIKADDADTLTTLIKQHPNLIYCQFNNGQRLLHRAAQMGSHRCIKILIAANSNVNTYTQFHQTALHFAASYNQPHVIPSLITAKTINYGDKNGYTPFHIACMNGNFDAAQELYAHEADIEQSNLAGITPLATAAFKGHLHIVRWLVLIGATVTKRVIDSAIKGGHAEIIEFLEAVQIAQAAPANSWTDDTIPHCSQSPFKWGLDELRHAAFKQESEPVEIQYYDNPFDFGLPNSVLLTVLGLPTESFI